MSQKKRPSCVRVWVSARLAASIGKSGRAFSLAVHVDVPRELGLEGLKQAVSEIRALVREEELKTSGSILGVLVSGQYSGGLAHALAEVGLLDHVYFVGTWHYEESWKDFSGWITHARPEENFSRGLVDYARLDSEWKEEADKSETATAA